VAKRFRGQPELHWFYWPSAGCGEGFIFILRISVCIIFLDVKETIIATIKRVISHLLSKFGVRIQKFERRGAESFSGYYVDDRFKPYYLRYCHDSMVSCQGMNDAYQAAKYIAESEVAGDIVECGVYRGGVSALMRDVVYDFSEPKTSRQHWLYDTFQGMADPTEFDFKGGRGVPGHYPDASDTLRNINLH
jgi:hypothetical protein